MGSIWSLDLFQFTEITKPQKFDSHEIRALRGVLKRESESIKMASLILMEPLGALKEANFRQEMATAGVLDLSGAKYLRMQSLTVNEILAGKRFYTLKSCSGSKRSEAMPNLPLG